MEAKTDKTDVESTVSTDLAPNESTESTENNALKAEIVPAAPLEEQKEAAKAEPKAEPAQNKPAKAKSRTCITINFTDGNPESEFVHLDKIMSARIEAGISRDKNHFIRQCIDFAINHEKQLKKQLFAVPEIEHRLLKDGFYTTENTGYEVCK